MEVDIKPGSSPNSINLKSRGVIPVAILSTATFDASSVDPDTVLFAGAPPVKAAQKDVDHDGVLDLIMHFRTQQTDIRSTDTEACVEGYTYGGSAIWGCDSVRIVPPHADTDGDSLGIGKPPLLGDAVEASVGTDQLNSCAADSSDDAWPPDVNNDQVVNMLDAMSVASHTSSTLEDPSYSARVDLQFDGVINVLDLVLLTPFLGRACDGAEIDNDGDTILDPIDADDDNDGYSDVVESHVGTDPTDACPDDASDDAWPPDIDNSTMVNVVDMLLYKPKMTGAFDPRYDLDASGAVNVIDLLLYKPLVNASCTTP